jgi:transcriptional regulator of acetoin/glycerol metabolism
VLVRLLQHSWPGNVRELSSVLETALLESANGVIRASNLALPDSVTLPAEPQLPVARPDNLTLDAVIRHHVQYVLDLNRGNKLRAARQLNISRSRSADPRSTAVSATKVCSQSSNPPYRVNRTLQPS